MTHEAARNKAWAQFLEMSRGLETQEAGTDEDEEGKLLRATFRNMD